MGNAENRSESEKLIGPEVFFVEENSFYRLSLSLEKEQMECVVQLELAAQAHESPSAAYPSPSDLIWFLTQNGIIQAIDYPSIYEFCAAVEVNDFPESYVVARGREPETGADGWFELMVKTTGEDQVFKEDEAGNVDLKTLNAYSEIESGQKLGMIHQPKAGIPGMTVTGRPVPAEAGQPFELLVGEGVELKYHNRVAFSTKSGRALLERNVLSVVDQLVVPGDLDLSVGNIDFNGFVEIKGDVPDDFRVKSTKGIKIHGLAGACRLESEGAIEVSSMAGKGVGTILCHGDFKAGFINQVTLHAYGDVCIGHEIRNSQVKATGRIIVEKGSIIGGECVAMQGIETRTAGTGSGLKTKLIAGVYFPDVDRFEFLRQELLSVNRQIKSLDQGLSPLERYVKRHPEAGEVTLKRLQILRDKMAQLNADKERLSAEVAASTTQQFNSQNPKINIHSTLLEGVSLILGNTTEEIRQQRSGPLSIIENTEDGGLRYLSLSPLHVRASLIEQDLLCDLDET